MVRYGLILSEQTFRRILTYGARHNKTVGKLINEVLNSFDWEESGKPVETPKTIIALPCFICGHESSMSLKNLGTSKMATFCSVCGTNALDSHKWRLLNG